MVLGISQRRKRRLRYRMDLMPGCPQGSVTDHCGDRVSLLMMHCHPSSQTTATLEDDIFLFLSHLAVSHVLTMSFKSCWSSSKDICLTWILQEKELSDGSLDICAKKKPSPYIYRGASVHIRAFPGTDLLIKGHLEELKEGSRPAAEELEPTVLSWGSGG